MFRVAICDDEKEYLLTEKELISNYMKTSGYQCEIDTFTSGVQLMEKGSEVARYDIIFLDVNMEAMDGIETAKQIRTYTAKPYIVFLTAFVSYALEGYKVDAIRYLLKDDKMLEKEMAECIDTIVDKMNYVENKHTFEFQEGRKTIRLDAVIYIESNLHRLEFHLLGQDKKTYTMYESLDRIAEELQEYPFCRVHKSYLVNMNYIENIKRYCARLSNGDIISISQSRYNDVRDEFTYYQGDI
ncbi:MAG: response regulator transcription factor [Lachnospiraceae bacterium]|nr:response regulator transcription factor [Lachnospiraceae bacterium]